MSHLNFMATLSPDIHYHRLTLGTTKGYTKLVRRYNYAGNQDSRLP